MKSLPKRKKEVFCKELGKKIDGAEHLMKVPNDQCFQQHFLQQRTDEDTFKSSQLPFIFFFLIFCALSNVFQWKD